MKHTRPLIMIALSAATAIASPERVRELVAELEGTTWEKTNRAQRLLAVDDPSVTLEDIETVSATMDMSPDVRHRLHQASLTRFNNHTPMGGLGVGFGATRVGHVEIQTIVGTDDFPASLMLKPGDVIIEVDGRVIQGNAHIRAEILSRLPGEMLPVLIKRDNAIIKRDLPLGAYTNLTGAVRIDTPVLAQALALRQARLGIRIPSPDTIGADIDADAWIQAAFPEGPAAHGEPMDDSIDIGVLLAGHTRAVFSGYPLYARRGRVWSSQGIAQQAILEKARSEIRSRMSKKFARRAQLVTLIKTVRDTGEEHNTLESLEPELRILEKQLAMIEGEIAQISQELDKLISEKPKPEKPDDKD